MSLYGLAESVNWSWRLRVDVCVGGPPAVGLYRPQQHDLPPEHYSYEHVDAEWLKRKPVSFVVFGKPGLDDHKLAAELSAYWGCIHVSMENGLADGRIDDQTMAAMRRGQAVYVGATASQLITILGIDTPYVHERGYVLTGLPRYVVFGDFRADRRCSASADHGVKSYIDMVLIIFFYLIIFNRITVRRTTIVLQNICENTKIIISDFPV